MDFPVSFATTVADSLSQHFRLLDWIVLIGYMALVSIIGVKLAGKQKNMQDFFRGGDSLPWYAVTASMIATIISAVTFVGVPAIAYREGGNFTYLQFGIIAGLLSRLFVAFVLVPAYYKKRIYSPYDYMGDQLGEAARSVTTVLFSVMGLLAQAARVYLTAVILKLVLSSQFGALEDATGISALVWSVSLVGVIAILWTMLGGISTVIWTDAMLFIVFVAGGVIALGVIVAAVPGGLTELLSAGWEANKFQLWSLFEPAAGNEAWASPLAKFFAEPYTIWAAIFAVTFGNIGAYGTDQLIAQRIFTCKGPRQAKIAILASLAGELVVALMLLVGVGLWFYYRTFPEALAGPGEIAIAENPDNIFPVFILTKVPIGLTGLIVAGIFAAAISSLTSILAALSQTTLSAVWLPLRGIDPEGSGTDDQNKEVLLVSRGLIVFWGVLLCGMAFLIDWYVTSQRAVGNDVAFLDLALGLASYIVGSLLAAFLLAWLPLKVNAWGLIWSAPLSIFAIYASRFHDAAAGILVAVVAGLLLVSWVLAAVLHRPDLRTARLLRTGWLVLGCGLMLLIWWGMWFSKIDVASGAVLPEKYAIAWPWYAPLGGFFALVWGWLLADRKSDDVIPQRGFEVTPVEPIAEPSVKTT